MTINMKKNAIEMTKKFAKAAAKFGSPEYKQLQEARRDNPTFSVVTVTRKTTTKKNTYKGLTYEYMEMYIQKHDDVEKSIMAEYLMLRGKTDEAEEALADAFDEYDEVTDEDAAAAADALELLLGLGEDEDEE